MPLRRSIRRAARDAAGWLLLAALVYAPWDYGGTGPGAIRLLNWMLAGMFFFWLISRSLGTKYRQRGDRNFFSPVLLTASGLLLLIGWGMALNAHFISDADYSITLPLTSVFRRAPGSADYALSLAMMRRVTALLASLWVVADLVQDERWLLRLWWGIGLAGGSIAFLGLLQKATGAQMIFWATLERGEPPTSTFFATYFYHGNAGAFLNLALPAVLGLAWRYTTRPANPVTRALWLTLFVIMIVAVASDTSRMGQLVAVLMILALAALSVGRIFRWVRHLEWKTASIALFAVGLAMWAVVQTSHLDYSLGRWERFRSTWTQDARWLVDKSALGALPAAGALGFGPGTFSVVFPAFNQQDAQAQGNWLFLHNDYLQTLLEWGWVGGLLWGVVLWGGMAIAGRSLSNRQRMITWRPRQRLVLALGCVALAGVALHAAVDFPLQIASIQLYAVVWLGVCWGSGMWGKEEGRRRKDEVGAERELKADNGLRTTDY